MSRRQSILSQTFKSLELLRSFVKRDRPVITFSGKGWGKTEALRQIAAQNGGRGLWLGPSQEEYVNRRSPEHELVSLLSVSPLCHPFPRSVDDLLLARKLSGNGKLQMFFGKTHGLTQLQMRLRGEES